MPGFTILSVFLVLTVLPLIYRSRKKNEKIRKEKEKD